MFWRWWWRVNSEYEPLATTLTTRTSSLLFLDQSFQIILRLEPSSQNRLFSDNYKSFLCVELLIIIIHQLWLGMGCKASPFKLHPLSQAQAFQRKTRHRYYRSAADGRSRQKNVLNLVSNLNLKWLIENEESTPHPSQSWSAPSSHSASGLTHEWGLRLRQEL
jgi:hypothetical protein